MLVSASKYSTVVPTTPFLSPPIPEPFFIDPDFTQYQIAITNTQYETAIREHQTYILIQRALISLVKQAAEIKYTNAVRNCITGQLPADIWLLKNHLFDTYGNINENELQTQYDITTKLTYDVSEPIDDAFNTVEDLYKVTELADCPYLARQQVNIRYLVVSKQPIFRNDVRQSMRKPIEYKTGTNVMAHFRPAHQELREMDTTINELGFQSANAKVEKVVDRLRVVKENTQDINVHLPPQPPQAVCPIQAQPQANAVIPQVDPNIVSMQQMMQNMQTMQDKVHQNFSTPRRGRGRGCSRGDRG